MQYLKPSNTKIPNIQLTLMHLFCYIMLKSHSFIRKPLLLGFYQSEH